MAQYTPSNGLNNTAVFPSRPGSGALAREQVQDMLDQMLGFHNAHQTETMKVYIDVMAPPVPLVAAKVDGTDTTTQLKNIFQFASDNGYGVVVMPKATYSINLLLLDGLSNILIDGRMSTLKGLSGAESELINISDCSNVQMINFALDGNDTFYRGVRVLTDNTDITISDFSIRNISPIIQGTPTDINSAAIDVDITRNHSLLFKNFKIDTVKNNDNGIIGDSIGSSRGIIVQANDADTSHSDIVFDNFTISNILSEDGDGIHVISNVENSTDFDVLFRNYKINNCQRRHIKVQTARGCVFDTFKLKHTDRTFSMNASISMLSMGNKFNNFDIDCKAIKGIEVSPFNNSDIYESNARNFTVVMDNTATISGSTVIPIDFISFSNYYTIQNVTLENFTATGPNSGLFARTFTRNVNIRNGTFYSYTNDKTGMDFTFNPGANLAADGTSISHKTFTIDNIVADGLPLVFGDNNTTANNGTVGRLLSRTNAQPYAAFDFKLTDVQIAPRQFRGTGAPTTGTYLLGDKFRISSPAPGGYAEQICTSAGTPGVWKGSGTIQS